MAGDAYDSDDYAQCRDIESEHSADEEWFPGDEKKRRNKRRNNSQKDDHRELMCHAANKKTWPVEEVVEKRAPDDALIGMLSKPTVVKSRRPLTVASYSARTYDNDNSEDEEPELVQLEQQIRAKATTPTINQEYETAQRERDQQMADEYVQYKKRQKKSLGQVQG